MANFRVGFGRAEITPLELGVPLLGWASSKNGAKGVGLPLYARVAVIHDSGDSLPAIFVCLDLWATTRLIRARIIAALETALPTERFDFSRLVIAATHTHSGPNGISDSLIYGAQTRGPSEFVIGKIVAGVAEAVKIALGNRRAAELSWGEAALSPGIVFNRSLEAWNANLDVTCVSKNSSAVDRRIRALRAVDENGRELGLLAWGACHATTLHADHRLIDPDFPGRAMGQVELRRATNGDFPPYVALLMQGAAGDLTANYRQSPVNGWRVGPFENDLRNSDRVASAFAEGIGEAADRARVAPLETGRICGHFEPLEMMSAEVDPMFASGRADARTEAPSLGLGFFAGTEEGPGPLAKLRRGFQGLQHVRRKLDLLHAAKKFVDLSDGLDGRVSRAIKYRKWLGKEAAELLGWWNDHPALAAKASGPMISTILPIQIVTIGETLIAAVPGEPTTNAGRRLERQLLATGRPYGIRRALVTGYANAYAGYVTTAEEYTLQRYEGAHTLFGKHTLGALQTAFMKIIEKSFRPDRAAHPSPGLRRLETTPAASSTASRSANLPRG